jgi:hypothetical protein
MTIDDDDRVTSGVDDDATTTTSSGPVGVTMTVTTTNSAARHRRRKHPSNVKGAARVGGLFERRRMVRRMSGNAATCTRQGRAQQVFAPCAAPEARGGLGAGSRRSPNRPWLSPLACGTAAHQDELRREPRADDERAPNGEFRAAPQCSGTAAEAVVRYLYGLRYGGAALGLSGGDGALFPRGEVARVQPVVGTAGHRLLCGSLRWPPRFRRARAGAASRVAAGSPS